MCSEGIRYLLDVQPHTCQTRWRKREDYLFLDEEQEELESKYGCPMVELDEDELLEIVEQFVKLTPESAKWEENMQGIKYKYQEECA